MKGHKFSDDEDAICTANGWLEDQTQQFFGESKCISVAGNFMNAFRILKFRSIALFPERK